MRDIKDVEGSAGGWFRGGRLAGVMRNMVPINDIIVPVSLARLKSRPLESKGSFPSTGFGRRLVLGEGKLSGVIVPRTKKMDGLDAGGCAQRER